MILHFFLNSLLVFFVLTATINFCLFAFRIKNSRLRCLCRSLPIIKLPIDLVIYGIFGYADTFFINLNPFSCKVYVQQLLLSIMPDHIRSEFGYIETMIIPEYIGSQIPAVWLQACIIGFIIISVLLILRKVFQIHRSQMMINKVFSASSLCPRIVSNPHLQIKLSMARTQILVSTELQIPLAAYHHYILIPNHLSEELTQDEFDAVIAHEFEHLRWKDPLLKIICSLICTFCWWIPTIWWLKKLEFDQEEASDSGLEKYKIDSLSLATAIMKVINQEKQIKIKYDLAPTCSLHSSKSNYVKRFETLLNSKNIRGPLSCAMEAACCLICLLTCISFWMC